MTEKRQVKLIAAGVLSAGFAVLLMWLYLVGGSAPATSPVSSAHHYFDYLGDGTEVISPIPQQVQLDARKVGLGEMLFQDPILSDSNVSCETCHSLTQAGVDQLPVSINVQGGFDVMNTPTVFNAGFNQYQMWSGRVASLEQQIDDVINNDKHMNSSWPAILQRLRRHDVYPALFADIYADGISVPAIQDALATFERSLITPDSAFDRYLRGDKQAISSEQKEGFRLFKDYGCISCHQGINLGGNVRALLGVFIERTKPGSDARGGSAEVELPQSEVNIYRAPPLRNVARTAPYFHNGSIANLHEAVIVMARSQLGRDMPAEHADKIVAFLDSLTGEYRGKPL